ncbi:MAG: UDP-N-acetylmuramate:L-alanyl-gamma-D-glutamyl-meso-diaminopimelate ligase [Acidobacteria bacterium 13_1_40CM_3_56_11]|nr:MAG: UDP-N-acetylmuramate:L-alanyl-gamma-D-glutamyl-meso-diaminopimelate ligase [Acidobacteria bacterium 13_1_40CM_3_56_11]
MTDRQKIYLIGICGTAMASLAGMLREKGYAVSGSDSDVYPPMSDFLARLEIPVFKGFNAENIQKTKPDLVVIGNALSRGNVEIEYVLDSGLRYASMAETVKELFIRGKQSIVVAGTHGKTTTTAMLAWILEVAGRKPSFLVGGIAENFGSSFQVRDGPDFVIEGDEYDTAFFDKGPKFLHYLPRIVLLKNIEFDHADIYADLEAIKTAFRRLINIVPRSGLIVAGIDSPVVTELIPAAFSRVATAGLGTGEWQAVNIKTTADGMDFEILRSDSNTGSFAIPLPGTFNVQNALGAIIVARDLGIPDEVIRRALSTFKSVKRRLEIRGEVNGIVVYDDFAHHPTAVQETLRAVRERHPHARVWAVFEPRSQTCRRKIFEPAFIQSFDPADVILIARVYGASHLAPAETLSPDRVAEGIRARGKRAFTFASTAEIVSLVASEARPGDHVVIMSNGGFDNIHVKLLERLRR